MTDFVFVVLISAIHVWEQGSTKRETILIAEQSSKPFIKENRYFSVCLSLSIDLLISSFYIILFWTGMDKMCAALTSVKLQFLKFGTTK